MGTAKEMIEAVVAGADPKHVILGESRITTGHELAKAIEAKIKSHMPNSTVEVRQEKSLGETAVYLFFAVAGSKDQTVNKIWHNDISLTKAFVYGVNPDGSLKEKLEFDPAMGGSISTKAGSIKVGLRKRKGTPDQIIKHVDSYFKKLAATLKANKDQLDPRHVELLKPGTI